MAVRCECNGNRGFGMEEIEWDAVDSWRRVDRSGLDVESWRVSIDAWTSATSIHAWAGAKRLCTPLSLAGITVMFESPDSTGRSGVHAAVGAQDSQYPREASPIRCGAPLNSSEGGEQIGRQPV